MSRKLMRIEVNSGEGKKNPNMWLNEMTKII